MGKKDRPATEASNADLVAAYVRKVLRIKLEPWQETALRELVEYGERAPKVERKSDDLAPWLWRRFGANRHAPAWEDVSEDVRQYWQHEARAVREQAMRTTIVAFEGEGGSRRGPFHLAVDEPRLPLDAVDLYGVRTLPLVTTGESSNVPYAGDSKVAATFHPGGLNIGTPMRNSGRSEWVAAAEWAAAGQYSEPMVPTHIPDPLLHTAYGVEGGVDCRCARGPADHGEIAGAD